MIYAFEWNTQIKYIQTIGANESTRKMVKRKNRRASMTDQRGAATVRGQAKEKGRQNRRGSWIERKEIRRVGVMEALNAS